MFGVCFSSKTFYIIQRGDVFFLCTFSVLLIHSFNSYSGGKVTKSEIGSMTIGVYIYANGDVSKSMFTRGIESGYKTTANGKWYDGSLDTATLDSSAVWAGLGL